MVCKKVRRLYMTPNKNDQMGTYTPYSYGIITPNSVLLADINAMPA